MIQGGCPRGHRHRRPRLPVRGRVQRAQGRARRARDGERRPGHERQPVLHRHRRGARPGSTASTRSSARSRPARTSPTGSRWPSVTARDRPRAPVVIDESTVAGMRLELFKSSSSSGRRSVGSSTARSSGAWRRTSSTYVVDRGEQADVLAAPAARGTSGARAARGRPRPPGACPRARSGSRAIAGSKTSTSQRYDGDRSSAAAGPPCARARRGSARGR